MPKGVAVTPTYAAGDLRAILAIEQHQVIDSISDLTEEQAAFRPNARAKSVLDIVWHLTYADLQGRTPQDPAPPPSPPTNLATARSGLERSFDALFADIDAPGKLQEPYEWWTGETLSYAGYIWAQIRHRSYHLGEIVYLRQVMELDEPKYFHET